MIDGVIFTPLSVIDTKGGDVMHAMKAGDHGYNGFGEAYFSTVESNAIKGWKLHHKMVLNLVVPVGAVRFVIFDDRIGSKTKGKFSSFTLSRKNYGRLTVPKNLWVAFQGMGDKDSLLLNIASISHNDHEEERKNLEEIDYDWD